MRCKVWQRKLDFRSIYWRPLAALFPPLIASASVMYLPFFVVP
jgi:hypothetical protein